MVRSLLKDRVFPWPAYLSKAERKRKKIGKEGERKKSNVR